MLNIYKLQESNERELIELVHGNRLIEIIIRTPDELKGIMGFTKGRKFITQTKYENLERNHLASSERG